MKRLFTAFIFFTIAFISLSSAANAPQNFNATVLGTSVNFSWSPASANTICYEGPCTFSHYILHQTGVTLGQYNGEGLQIGSISTTSFTLRNLSHGQHEFYLSALYIVYGDERQAFGTQRITVTVSSGAPPTPVNISALVNNSAIDVSWSASLGATTYQLERTLANQLPQHISLGSITTTSFKDTSASHGVSYLYRVRACNSTGCSLWVSSSPVTIPRIPTAPVSITAVSGSSSIQVNWPQSVGTAVYELQRNSAGLASVTARSYTDGGVVRNTSYIYRVRACNGTGCSTWVTSSAAMLIQQTEYIYDALGRLVGVRQNGAVKEGYRYDKADNRCSVSTTEIRADQCSP